MGVEGGKRLPRAKEILVQAWIELRQRELAKNWKLARAKQPLEKVDPIS